MNEKLSFQNIADALVQRSGVTKKVAETFTKAFFDTIVEALYMGEESIKVKGLGTFKLVQVDSRESVNVSNGERIVIAGYKKVSFAPEDSVVEVLNRKVEEEENDGNDGNDGNLQLGVVADGKDGKDGNDGKDGKDGNDGKDGKDEKDGSDGNDENDGENGNAKVVEVDGPAEADVKDEIDALIEVPEPVRVETPQDAFGGIDMLISTPESVEEVRQQYEEAKVRMENAVEEARKANAEKMRLEKLLERLEKYMKPETLDHPENQEIPENPETPEIPVSVERAEGAAPVRSDDTKRKEAFQRVMMEKPNKTEEEEPQKKSRRGWVIALIVLFFAAIIFFIVKTFFNIEAVEEVQVVETLRPIKPNKPVKPAAPKVEKDSLQLLAQKEDSIKKAAADSLKNKVKVSDEKKPADKAKPSDEKKPADKAKPADEKKSADKTKSADNKKPSGNKRPATHKVKPGESLTRISQQYYGTKDSVRAILRVNTFKDPNNIPVGAVVKLP